MTSPRRHSDVVDLNPYVDELRHQLVIAAEGGGDQARQVVEPLLAPMQSSIRLVLLDALTAAAGEITSELAPGSVEVRLRGRDPEFVVTPPPVEDLGGAGDVTSTSPVDRAPSAPLPPIDGEDAGTSRVTLRLPEPLKLRIEEAAGREGLSVNSWLVRTLTAGFEPNDRDGRTTRPRAATGGQRFTGWAR